MEKADNEKGKVFVMNKVILIGRLTRDPDVRYSQGDKPLAVAKFNLAVERRYKREGDEQTADFINCTAFGKIGEFIERYCHQGTKLVVEGRIQTGSYTNKDGLKIFTTEVMVEHCEFAESKAAASGNTRPNPEDASNDGFMNIPDNVEDEGLPFH